MLPTFPADQVEEEVGPAPGMVNAGMLIRGEAAAQHAQQAPHGQGHVRPGLKPMQPTGKPTGPRRRGSGMIGPGSGPGGWQEGREVGQAWQEVPHEGGVREGSVGGVRRVKIPAASDGVPDAVIWAQQMGFVQPIHKVSGWPLEAADCK